MNQSYSNVFTPQTRRQFIRSSANLAGGAIHVLSGSLQHALAATGEPRRPFPHRPVYLTGSIRPDHRTQAQLDADVIAAYDRWKSNYLVVKSGSVRVAFGKPGTENHDVTVSEGQGYGMVIVAHMAGYDPEAKELFDGLWRFVQEHPSDIDARLMGWKIPLDLEGNDSAFDGDCDIGYALLLADAQWGSDGEFDYRSAADGVLGGILESTIGPQSRLPMLGDWVDPNGEQYNQYTPRPSDFMTGHFRAFGRATGVAAWSEVMEAVQRNVDQLQESASPVTGLLPDFVQPISSTVHTPRPADPNFLEGPADGAFSYNAGRTPWRLGTDALINSDPRSSSQVRKMSHWVERTANGDPLAIRAGYTLEGASLPDSDYFTTFFAAPFGVAAMTEPTQQQWLNDIYDSVHDTSEDYYEDSVTLFCMLVMTGNFWDPTIDANA